MVCCSRTASLCLTPTGQSADRPPTLVAQANSWHTCTLEFCRCCAFEQQAGCRRNLQPSVPADCKQEVHRLHIPSAGQLQATTGKDTSMLGPCAHWAQSNQAPAILALADCTVPYSMCRLTEMGFTLTCAAPMQPDSKQGLLHMIPV